MSFIKSKFFIGALVAVAFVFAGSANAAYMHTVTLKMGMSNSSVMSLQQTLNMTACKVAVTGTGSMGMETMYFGGLTNAAVKCFQVANGLTADGVVGPMTAAKLMAVAAGNPTQPGCPAGALFNSVTGAPCGSTTNFPAGCTSAAGYSPTTGVKCDSNPSTPNNNNNGPLTGGAGSITVDESSEFSSEEVGEGAEDEGVLAFEIEADDESDVEITSVKVEFVESGSTSSEDLSDYVESVSIWLDGKMVGEADAEDFSESSDVWTKSISLDGAIVRSGDTEEFTVAVTALGNLDSGDIDSDAWTVDVLNVRFEDGDGVVTTEDTDSDSLEQTFDFASFAAATDLDLQFSLTDDEDAINEAHVIDVDGTDDTENVELLAFTIEADGDSDVNISELNVTLTSTEAAGTDFDDVADIVTKVTLWMDGEEIASESTTDAGANDLEVIVFDDLDIDVGANEEIELIVAVDLIDTGGVLDNSDTIKAEITTTNADDTEAEDESGEELGTTDISGSALGEASTVLASGLMATLVSTDADATPSGVATVDDTGTFKIVFDVTAFDTDVYVDGTAIADESGGTTYQDIDASTTSVATGVLECSACDEAANDTFKVSEGETERFTLTIAGSGADVFASASLTSILYALTAIDGDTLYTYNMGDFETDSVWLDSN